MKKKRVKESGETSFYLARLIMLQCSIAVAMGTLLDQNDNL